MDDETDMRVVAQVTADAIIKKLARWDENRSIRLVIEDEVLGVLRRIADAQDWSEWPTHSFRKY